VCVLVPFFVIVGNGRLGFFRIAMNGFFFWGLGFVLIEIDLKEGKNGLKISFVEFYDENSDFLN
jgi:hypothetical protein